MRGAEYEEKGAGKHRNVPDSPTLYFLRKGFYYTFGTDEKKSL
jgi:hypothetical protein